MTKTLERINFDNIGAPTRYADDIYTLKACMTVAKWQQFGQKCVFPLTSGNRALPLRASPVHLEEGNMMCGSGIVAAATQFDFVGRSSLYSFARLTASCR